MKNRMKCGLLGRRLGHSYSPLIHSYLGEYDYELFEKEPDAVGAFIRGGGFDAINVTVPYKSAVMEHLDIIGDSARRIGSVNTIVRTEDGKLLGENTDCLGFIYMMRRADIEVKGKKVLVLGSGGSSLAVRTALEDMKASEIVVISRTGENNYGNISKHADAEVIVNTTPVGMYPECGKAPLSLDGFFKLYAVADLIYNPRMTELLFNAKEKRVKYVGGLSMLVAQAKAAAEIFCRSNIDDSVIEKIISDIERRSENIVLVGMPGCGKSTVGKALARILSRELVDTDRLVEKAKGMSIPEIFLTEGEEAFRSYEHEALSDACKKSGFVIATGGGAPTIENNRRPMKQNGRVVYLTRDLEELSRDGRPLSAGADMEKMYEKRRAFYEGCADVTVKVDKTPELTAKKIIEALGYDRMTNGGN